MKIGTKFVPSLGVLAGELGVSTFVLVSTDKAVRPTSIMGASKRMAELIVQDLGRRFPTRYVAVRFGNVMGSAGSVIPIFREQIARGEPVTVTHPQVRRYFMTIPEAAQLVLQAGAMGEGGEIYILDMGESVRILDLARDMTCFRVSSRSRMWKSFLPAFARGRNSTKNCSSTASRSP